MHQTAAPDITAYDVVKVDTEQEIKKLEEKTLAELREIGKEAKLTSITTLRKQELIDKIIEVREENSGQIYATGTLEILPEGYGFLRKNGYTPSPEDIYVSLSQIKRFGLRTGDYIKGQIRPPKESEKYFGLLRIEAINDSDPESAKDRPLFGKLTPVYPEHRIQLETKSDQISTRLIDLVSPIGKGQRGLIVSQPKAGKTVLLKLIANAITYNHPEITVMALLIDERPEEVTDFERNVKGEVVASTFDERPEHHIQVAEMLLQKAKRQVEHGRDVVILLDSITRLARAYNLVMPSSGKTLSGGLDPNSLHKPKRFLGAARNLELGGSLTIIATALVETGSRLDDVIFEEFKGTGNMELMLNRDLANRRIFPAIDILNSGTRHEELLYSEQEVEAIRNLRAIMDSLGDQHGAEFVIDRISNKAFPTNKLFIDAIPGWYNIFLKGGLRRGNGDTLNGMR
jgi:transcription termination factor Rho